MSFTLFDFGDVDGWNEAVPIPPMTGDHHLGWVPRLNLVLLTVQTVTQSRMTTINVSVPLGATPNRTETTYGTTNTTKPVATAASTTARAVILQTSLRALDASTQADCFVSGTCGAVELEPPSSASIPLLPFLGAEELF